MGDPATDAFEIGARVAVTAPDGSGPWYLILGMNDGIFEDNQGAWDVVVAVRTDDCPTGDDCDDSRADVAPDQPEVCDTVDNDCDGTVDNDNAADATTWYADRARERAEGSALPTSSDAKITSRRARKRGSSPASSIRAA